MGKGVNYSGAFMRRDTPLEQLPEKPVKLGASFFRKLLRRIETIVPTESGEESPLITIKPPADGASPGLVISAETITITVCVDGEPRNLDIVGRISS